MKRYLVLALAGLALAAQAQSMKPGLWEMQNKMGGNPEMDRAMAQMQQQMASMTPEQRKMMQDMMAKQGVSLAPGKGGAMAVRICVTPEMAARQELPSQTEGDCTTTVTSRSGNTMKMKFVCKNPASDGEGTYTFQGDSAYTANMVVRTSHQGKPQTTTIDAQGKWVGADCGSVKPVRPPGK